MGKNILVVRGGGRPGENTAQLAESFAKGAVENGHNVELISLAKYNVGGCMGCNACRYGKPCVQKDGFNELVPKIKVADCIEKTPHLQRAYEFGKIFTALVTVNK